jgi:glutaredoxin
MMSPHEKKQLLTLNETLSKKIQIGVIETDHEKSRSIKQFCDTLSQMVPKIRIRQEEGDSNEPPAIRVHRGLRYQAVPSGTEIGPFIEALQLLASDKAQINESLGVQVEKINFPTNLVVYVSPQCTYCPEAVRQLLPLPVLNHHIRLTIIDGIHFPELAEKDRVQSVPTLILEGRFRWTGRFQINEIAEVMASRDPGALGPASLEMMLKEGKASRLAEMMLEKTEIFPAFYEVLVHRKWPVRLGAMVVMDEIIEKNLGLAVQILEPLCKRFYKVDNRVKGDLLYVFGEMQQKEIIPWLETIINGDDDAEVKEAAREALDKLKQKK